MWQKTDVYPYHRKGLDSGKEKKGLINRIDLGLIGKKLTDLSTGKRVVFLVGIAFLLGRAQVLGELLPFGIAFFSAMAIVRGSIWPVMIAVGLGTLTVTDGLALYLNLAVIAGLAVIFQSSLSVIKGHWLIPPVIIFTANFVIKAVGYIFFAPGIYYWVIALVESLLAAGFTILLSYTLTNIANGEDFAWDKLTPEEMACLLVVCLGLVIGLAEISFWELSLRAIVSKIVILAGALIYGPGAGAIIGSMVGVIPGGNNIMTPAFAGILAFSGVLAGVFRQFHKLGVFFGFALGNLIFTVYLADQVAVVNYLEETLLAGVVLFLLPVGVIQRVPEQILPSLADISKHRSPQRTISQSVNYKVKELSQIFREVARTFEETAQNNKNSTSIELVGENIKKRLCQECSAYKRCWFIEREETKNVVKEMIERLTRQGSLYDHNLPGSFQDNCRRQREFILALACSFDTWQVNDYWQKKMWENSKMVPNQLKGISEIMDNLVDKVKEADNYPQFWENKFLHAAKEKGISIKGVRVTEKLNEGLEVIAVQKNCGGKFDCTEMMAAVGAELLGKKMRVEKLTCDYQKTTGNCKYKLKPALQFKVVVGKAQTTKTGSPISGDSFSIIPLTEGKYGLVLSDGMGTGQRAKLESNTTVALLEHLLESGFDKETAVNTINAILILRSKEESFATLDMAIVDLYSGQLEHTKIGAVPSFIKRGSQVGIIEASSLPIGILNNVESVTITEQLQVGDIIVLVTDGVLEAAKKILYKEKWVQELLAKLSTDDPQEIADQILFQARVLSADKNRDDMTVIVGRIDSRLHGTA